LAQIAPSAILALFIISVLAVSNEITSRLNELPGEFLRFADMLWLSVYFLPILIPLILPMAFFVGILMAFGRMGQLGEIIAIKASGISLKRLALPVILTGLVLSGVCFWVQNTLQPWGINRASDILYNELLQRATLDKLDPGEMIDEFSGWRVHFASKNPESGALYDIDLISTDPEDGQFIQAGEAKLVKIDNNYTLEMKNVSTWVGSTKSESPRASIPFPRPSSMDKGSIDRQNKNIHQLFDLDSELQSIYDDDPSENNRKELSKIRRDLGERFSLPFAAFAVAMAGAPIGARARRAGRSFTFAAGFSIVLIYYVLMIVVEPSPSSLVSIPEAILRAWIPNFALIGLGLILMVKVDRV
jgi:lipopolysaccharide export LptBFGC system permease protein LptF